MVNGLHLNSAFIQSTLQCMPLIHPFTHQHTNTPTVAMQGTHQLVRSNWGFGILLRDTSTRPGWDQTGNPPTARRLLLPPEPYHPPWVLLSKLGMKLEINTIAFSKLSNYLTNNQIILLWASLPNWKNILHVCFVQICSNATGLNVHHWIKINRSIKRLHKITINKA